MGLPSPSLPVDKKGAVVALEEGLDHVLAAQLENPLLIDQLVENPVEGNTLSLDSIPRENQSVALGLYLSPGVSLGLDTEGLHPDADLDVF